MDMYREHILDHYKHPRNFGHLNKPNAIIEQKNVSCGDRISMEIRFKTSREAGSRSAKQSPKSKVKIEDIRFTGDGCVISQASASMLTEKVKNMKRDDILKLNAKDITGMLGTTLTPTRIKCAVLPLEVLHQAINSVSKSVS